MLALTYDETAVDLVGSNTVYVRIRNNGVLVSVITSYYPALYSFSDLIKIGNNYYPYDASLHGYLREDSGTWYLFLYDAQEDSYRAAQTVTISSQSPSDYLSDLTSGNYTLEVYE